jgi:hypothetical protein
MPIYLMFIGGSTGVLRQAERFVRCVREHKECSSLSPCDLARWKLQRNQDSRSMRQAWDDKWSPGRPLERHLEPRRLTAAEVLQRYKEEDLPAFCEIPLDNVN